VNKSGKTKKSVKQAKKKTAKTAGAAFPRVEALRPKAQAVAPESIAGDVMRAVQFYSPYGYRAKIGLIMPGVNTNLEPECYLMAPKGVSFHSSKLLLTGKATQESYDRMERDTERAAEELATAEVDVVAWACTSGSVLLPPEKIEKKISGVTSCPAITTISAVIAALKALKVRRVALGTPYVSFINETEIGFLEKAGFKVTAMYGLELGEIQQSRRGIGRVPPQSMHRFARHIDSSQADAIFISCTNVAGVGEIAAIEENLGKPMITSNLATFWHALRLAGVNDKIEGFGRLLAGH
jgi:maleate cis-trans isomerase